MAKKAKSEGTTTLVLPERSAIKEDATMKKKKSTAVVATKAKKAPVVNLDDEIASDAQKADLVPVPPDVLSRITAAASELLALRRRIEKGTALLEELDRERRRYEIEVLPALMQNANITNLGLLDDDYDLLLEDKIFASIAKANKAKAAQWFEKSGYGALLNCAIHVPVPKGDAKALAKVRATLTKAKIAFEEDSGIHPKTLGAFVKESLADGRKLPKEISYHVEPTAIVKQKTRGKKTRTV